jgi:hypothetical protein
MVASEVLFAFVRDRSSTFATLKFDPAPLADYANADVWLLASLLQKAVRRGELQAARRAGHQLLKLDPPRLWRRIMTLALEDIGIGDITACAALVGLATAKETRRLLEPHTLDVALALGCGALKDRSSDHLTSILRLSHPDRALLKASSINALLAVVASASQPWLRRLHAARLAEERCAEQKNAILFDSFAEWGVPAPLLTAARVYHRRGRDGLAVLTCLAWCFWHETPSHSVRLQTAAEICSIGDLPDYAFDPLHTRLGQRAVDLWLRSYLTKVPFGARQVAAALWNIESAACDRILDWPLGREIESAAHSADLIRRAVPAERHASLYGWVQQQRQGLCCARKAVFESEQRQRSAVTRPEPMF